MKPLLEFYAQHRGRSIVLLQSSEYIRQESSQPRKNVQYKYCVSNYLGFIYAVIIWGWKRDKFFIQFQKSKGGKYSGKLIEIINNTRGGIVILNQSKKGNAAIGGQI